MRYAIFAGVLALAACSGADSAESNVGGETGSDAATMPVALATLTPERGSPVDDQVITCTRHVSDAVTATDRMAVADGAIKVYVESQNIIGDFCASGEVECVFGWQDGKAVNSFVNPGYGRITRVFDVDGMTMDMFVEKEDGQVEHETGTCESAPLPTDAVYM